jgi:hypothetical protein
MSETHETHERHTVETEAPAEHAPVAVVETVAAAEAAAALAQTTAAAAEIDAAERVRDYAAELDECRSQISSLGTLFSASTTADAERERALAERLSLLESGYAERLERLESHPALTPRPSEPSEPETEPAPTEANPMSLAGAEVGANLGPAEASAGASLGSPEPVARRRRRWI